MKRKGASHVNKLYCSAVRGFEKVRCEITDKAGKREIFGFARVKVPQALCHFSRAAPAGRWRKADFRTAVQFADFRPPVVCGG